MAISYLWQKRDQPYQKYHFGMNMICTSLVLQKNQKVPDILHTLQGYLVEDLWLHLHQIVQMSDDIADQLKMQLNKTKYIYIYKLEIQKGKEIKNWKG